MCVMNCDRRGCNNFMCDRHSDRFGYICDDCFEDMVNRAVWSDEQIQMFMRSMKPSGKTKEQVTEILDMWFIKRSKTEDQAK